ncbi:poly-beta-1,6-N-acetyl-D-glucosamine biosynthesis protein PgaD [Achromobacter denitrificans]
MIITTQRSRAGYLLDLVLTAVGWFAFVYLFGAGIMAILREAAPGPGLSPWPAFVPTARTLGGYALFALANAAVLVAWAVYNHRRFSGKDRRKPVLALSDRRLAMSFAVTPGQLSQLRSARAAVIHHGSDGEITVIENLSPLLSALRAG